MQELLYSKAQGANQHTRPNCCQCNRALNETSAVQLLTWSQVHLQSCFPAELLMLVPYTYVHTATFVPQWHASNKGVKVEARGGTKVFQMLIIHCQLSPKSY